MAHYPLNPSMRSYVSDFPTQFPQDALQTILSFLRGQQTDTRTVIEAAYEVLGFGLGEAFGQGRGRATGSRRPGSATFSGPCPTGRGGRAGPESAPAAPADGIGAARSAGATGAARSHLDSPGLAPAPGSPGLAGGHPAVDVPSVISESFYYLERLILCPRSASYHRRGLALSAVTNREQGHRSLKTSSSRFRREDCRVKLESQPRTNQ
jgi:hypothetical protein